MSVTFEMQDEELRDKVVGLVAKDITDAIKIDVQHRRKAYTTAVREVVWGIIKGNLESYSATAIKQAVKIVAGNTIKNQALQKVGLNDD